MSEKAVVTLDNFLNNCPEVVRQYMPLGCVTSQSWGTIGFFSVFGLALYTIQYRRNKKDKIVRNNLIYFAILLFVSIFGVLLLGKIRYNKETKTYFSIIPSDSFVTRGIDAVFKISALLMLFILLVRQDTLREVGEDFTNTNKDNNDDKHKKVIQ
jgi:hypothetical protein